MRGTGSLIVPSAELNFRGKFLVTYLAVSWYHIADSIFILSNGVQTNVLDGGKGLKGLFKVVLLTISLQRRSVPVAQFPFGDQEKPKMTSYPNAQINEKCWIN